MYFFYFSGILVIFYAVTIGIDIGGVKTLGFTVYYLISAYIKALSI